MLDIWCFYGVYCIKNWMLSSFFIQCPLCVTDKLLCIICIVIGAQIATPESLQEKDAIEFPSSSTGNNLTMFANMTPPMIQIPTTVIVNQIANEGKCTYSVHVCCNKKIEKDLLL